MVEILTIGVAVGAAFGLFAVVGIFSDVVAPAVERLIPPLGRAFERFFNSLPIARDDWNE